MSIWEEADDRLRQTRGVHHQHCEHAAEKKEQHNCESDEHSFKKPVRLLS
jgi:hypothetical protein